MEKHYFIIRNDQQEGPFTLDQLRTMGLNPKTKIWYQGLDSWKMLYEVPEILELQNTMPPDPNATGNSNWQPPSGAGGSNDRVPPKSYLTEAILATIFCCWPLGIPAIVHASRVEGRYERGDYEGAEEASRQAKQYMQYSFWLGFAIAALYILFLVATGGNGVGRRRF